MKRRTRRVTLLGTAACVVLAAPALAATGVISLHSAQAVPPRAAHEAPAAHAAPEAAGHPAGYEPAGIPTVPEEYARAAFDAWVHGDQTRLEELATPSVVDLLTARPWSADEGWGDQTSCEGAAGSSYCTRRATSVQLTLRVGNELASQGAPHAVVEAFFEPLPGETVALWPVTTQEEADNSQQQVDEGHSPWQADRTAVATFYGENVIGWTGARIEPAPNGAIRITNPATGAQFEVTMAQPARQGEGGIWAIVAVRSSTGS